MGLKFSGTFTKFNIAAPTPVMVPSEPLPGDLVHNFTFNDTLTPSLGSASPSVVGTPTFSAPLSAPHGGSIKVVNFTRGDDTVTYSGDFSAIRTDFTIQFWLYVNPSDGSTNQNVFEFGGGSGGIRCYMRATNSIGNSQGQFTLQYRDQAGDFHPLSVVADVGNWNHFTIGKKGQVFGYVKNGIGASDTFQRTNGTTAVTGSSQTTATVTTPTLAQMNGMQLKLGGGIGYSMADFMIQSTSILPMTNMLQYATTPYHANLFY